MFAHSYSPAKDSLWVLPDKNKIIGYYTKLDEDQKIFLDYYLTKSLVCSFHNDSQMILDVEKYPEWAEC